MTSACCRKIVARSNDYPAWSYKPSRLPAGEARSRRTSLQLVPNNRIIQTTKKLLAKPRRQLPHLRHRLHRRSPPMHLNPPHPKLFHKECEQLRRDRPRVSRIQIKVRSENRQALRVGSLDRQDAAGSQAAGAQPYHLRQAFRRQMLHHLRTEDAVERRLRLPGKIRKQV